MSSSSAFKIFDTFYFTQAGRAIVTSSATLSVLSSLAVMYVIGRSQSGLSTVYHRIMFFISFWDIVSSSAMAMTTIPMPVDTIYPFQGNKYGNIATCEAQAFLYIVGSTYVICANVGLNAFYVCSIRYNMKEETMKKYLEPTMLVITTLLAIPLPVLLLVKNYLNPMPFDAYCSFGSYPKDCSVENGVECIRGNDFASSNNFVRTSFLCGMAVSMFLVALSMTLVIMTAYRLHTVNQSSAVESYEDPVESNFEDDPSGKDDANSEPSDSSLRIDAGEQKTNRPDIKKEDIPRILLRQAFMYIGAFWLTYGFSVVSYALQDSLAVQMLKCIFQPLQGFFNGIIFMHHKIHNLRRTDADMTYWMAAKTVVSSPKLVPEMFVSCIELVKEEGNKTSTVTSQKSNANALEEAIGSAENSSSPFSFSQNTPSVDFSNAASSTGISYTSNPAIINSENCKQRSYQYYIEPAPTQDNINENEKKAELYEFEQIDDFDELSRGSSKMNSIPEGSEEEEEY